jgi:hypothetical protein
MPQAKRWSWRPQPQSRYHPKSVACPAATICLPCSQCDKVVGPVSTAAARPWPATYLVRNERVASWDQ